MKGVLGHVRILVLLGGVGESGILLCLSTGLKNASVVSSGVPIGVQNLRSHWTTVYAIGVISGVSTTGPRHSNEVWRNGLFRTVVEGRVIGAKTNLRLPLSRYKGTLRGANVSSVEVCRDDEYRSTSTDERKSCCLTEDGLTTSIQVEIQRGLETSPHIKTQGKPPWVSHVTH